MVEPSGQVLKEIWSKLALNVATLPTSSTVRVTADRLLDAPEMQELMKDLLHEVVAVAIAQSIPLDFDERWEAITGLLRKLAPGTKGSMYQDVENRRQTEIDVMCGAIVEAGAKLNIPTPCNRAMIGLIRASAHVRVSRMMTREIHALRHLGRLLAALSTSAWREIPGVECGGLQSHARQGRRAGANSASRPSMTTRKAARGAADFVDNSPRSAGTSHRRPCAQHGIPCICQTAASLADAEEMVAAQRRKRSSWWRERRWQAPILALRQRLAEGVIGTPFRARFTMISGFDCWANQPALADLGQFILTDLGTHLLDTARACFGEASSLYCQTHRTLAPAVQGENVATIMLTMGKARTSVVVEMAYAKTPHERDSFPQTLAFIEGPLGSLELGSAYRLRVTTARGRDHPAPADALPWADPAYDIAHASIVPCHVNLLAALRGEGAAEPR